MKKSRSGFTILETVLVLAISTLLFMSVTIGIGRRIATGRYETASNEVADYFRDIYSATLNTENARLEDENARDYCTLASATIASGSVSTDKQNDFFVESGQSISTLSSDPTSGYPGRSNCAIYGKILFFGAKNDDAINKVYSFDVVGEVVSAKKDNITNRSQLDELQDKPVLDILKEVRADYLASVPQNLTSGSGNCYVSPAGSYAAYESDWGTQFTTANFGEGTGRDKGDPFVGMVMIVRSPATGDVSTFFYEGDVFYETNDSIGGLNLDNLISSESDPELALGGCGGILSSSSIASYSLARQIDKFPETPETTYDDGTEKYNGFCIDSDDFYVSISGVKKFVEFLPNGQNASAIKLDESESNPCRR